MKDKDFEKVMGKIKDAPYPYYDNSHSKDVFQRRSLNCRGEICPGSHERTQKIRELLNRRIYFDDKFMENYSNIIRDLHSLMKEEHMNLTKCSEREADQWVDAFVYFHHVKPCKDKDGKDYCCIDPILGERYED